MTLPRQGAGRLVWAGLVCVAVTALVYLISVRTGWGQQVGNDALAGRSQAGADSQRAGQRLLDTISVASLAVGGLSLMTLAVLRGRWRLALGVAVLMGGANVTTQVLKRYILDRPDLLAGPAEYHANSLPSGHCTAAATLALALVLVVPRPLRRLAAVVALAYAGGVGVAVLATGWHRAGDAVAAWGVVGAWTFAVAAGLVVLRGGWTSPAPHQRERSERTSHLLGQAAAVLLGLWAVGLLVTLAAQHATLDRVRNGAAFWGGCVWIVGSLLALLALVVWALRDIALDTPAAPSVGPADPAQAPATLRG
jgi:PAP2 superfamily